MKASSPLPAKPEDRVSGCCLGCLQEFLSDLSRGRKYCNPEYQLSTPILIITLLNGAGNTIFASLYPVSVSSMRLKMQMFLSLVLSTKLA